MLIALQYFCTLVSSCEFDGFNDINEFAGLTKDEISDYLLSAKDDGPISLATGKRIKPKNNTKPPFADYDESIICSGPPVQQNPYNLYQFENFNQNQQMYTPMHPQSFDPSSEYKPEFYYNIHGVPVLANSYGDGFMYNNTSPPGFYSYGNGQNTFAQSLNFPPSSMNNLRLNSQNNSSLTSTDDSIKDSDSISNVSSKKTDESLSKIEMMEEIEERLTKKIMEKLLKNFDFVEKASPEKKALENTENDYLVEGETASGGLPANKISKITTSPVSSNQKTPESQFLQSKGKNSSEIGENPNNRIPNPHNLQSSSKNTGEVKENASVATNNVLKYSTVANKESTKFNNNNLAQSAKINSNPNVNTKKIVQTQTTPVLVSNERNNPSSKQEVKGTLKPSTTQVVEKSSKLSTTQVVEKSSKLSTTQVVEKTSISAETNDKCRAPRNPQPIRKQTVSKADIEREEQRSKLVKEFYSTKEKVAAAPEVAFIKKEEPKEEPTIEIERKKVTPKNKPAKKSGKKPATKSVASISASNINLNTESNNNISDETLMEVETTIIDEENGDSLNKDEQDTDKTSNIDLNVSLESGLHQKENLESLDKTELTPEKTSNSDSKKLEELISIKEEKIESLEETNQKLEIISKVNAVEPKDLTSTIEEKVESCDQKINTETKQQEVTEDINSTISEESKPESQKNTKKGKKSINNSNINPPTSEKQADIGNEDTKSETTSENKSKETEIKQDSSKTSKKAKSKDPEPSKNELGATPKQPTSKQPTSSSKKSKTKKSSKNEDDENFDNILDEFKNQYLHESSVKTDKDSKSNFDLKRELELQKDLYPLKEDREKQLKKENVDYDNLPYSEKINLNNKLQAKIQMNAMQTYCSRLLAWEKKNKGK